MLKKLEGTEKQVNWANDIREKALEIAKKNELSLVVEDVENIEEAGEMINKYKDMTSKYKNDTDKHLMLRRREDDLSFVKSQYGETQENSEKEITIKTEIRSGRTASRVRALVNKNSNTEFSELTYKTDSQGNYEFTIPANNEEVLRKTLEELK